MLTIIQNEIRLLIIVASIQGIELRTMDMGLTRRKGMWWLHLYMVFKTMSLAIIPKVLITYNCRIAGWDILGNVLEIVLSALVYILFIVLWEGEMLHILLVACVGEIITYPTMIVLLLVNRLENRDSLTIMDGPFMVLDLLIPVGIILLFLVARPLLKRIMHFIGNLYLPYRNVLWVVFLGVFIYSRIPNLVDQKWSGHRVGAITVGEIALLGLLVVLFLLMLVVHQNFIFKQEEAFLTLQIDMLKRRAGIIKNTQAEYVAARHMLTEQMKSISEKLDAGAEIPSEEIEEYLRQLKPYLYSEYRGAYCRDALVDEMLSWIRKTVETSGGKLLVSLNGYVLGNVEEEDLVKLLFCLQQAVRRPGEGEEISITMAGEQFLLAFEASGFAWERKEFATLQTLVRKYKGTISYKNSKNRQKVLLVLEQLDEAGKAGQKET